MSPEIAHSAGRARQARARRYLRASVARRRRARGAASTYRAGVSSVCNQTQCKLTLREPGARGVPARRH